MHKDRYSAPSAQVLAALSCCCSLVLSSCDEREGYSLAPEHSFVAATTLDGRTFLTDEGDTLYAVNSATMPRYTEMRRALISYDLLDQAVLPGEPLPMMLSDQMGYNEIPTFEAADLGGVPGKPLAHLASSADRAYVSHGYLNVFPELVRDDVEPFSCALRLDSVAGSTATLTLLYDDGTTSPDYLWHGQVSLALPAALHERLAARLAPTERVTLRVGALTEHGPEGVTVSATLGDLRRPR